MDDSMYCFYVVPVYMYICICICAKANLATCSADRVEIPSHLTIQGAVFQKGLLEFPVDNSIISPFGL